jgi:alkyl sulfatase BDS1-like metallo-beta-lactamase superfamily hydrolase
VVDADTQMPIVAPQNFLEHAVSENVYAGREERPTNRYCP